MEINTAEPFGLARGIPLLSNSILSKYDASGKRAEASLYSNSQSNKRENWEIKSYEVLVKTASFEMQGMRGSTVFATGKFSSQTGLNHMGVRTLDSARGVWLSPDLYLGQNLEAIVSSVIEGNLFQYALNNPISNLDPTGMKNYVEKDAGKGFDSDKSWKEPLSSINSNNTNTKDPMAPSNQSSSSSNNSRDTDQSIDSSNNTGGGNSGSSSSPPEFVKPTWSVIPLTKETCGSMIAAAAVRAVMGVAVSTAAVELAVPSGSASLLVGAPIAREMFAEAAAMGILGLGCFEYISMRGDGSGEPPPNLSPPEAGRRGAFREAKRDYGIPVSSQPDKVIKVPDTTNPGKMVRDYIWGEFKYNIDKKIFEPVKGKSKVIQDHGYGHNFGRNDPQNRGPHFNGKNRGHYNH